MLYRMILLLHLRPVQRLSQPTAILMSVKAVKLCPFRATHVAVAGSLSIAVAKVPWQALT